MPTLQFRGPFLLLFAVDQQLGSLLSIALADAPLRPADFAVYSALRLQQPTTPTQLADSVGLRATTLSSHLIRMSELGHLERRPNPRDGRSRLIALTDEGVRVTEACFPPFARTIETFRKHLGVDEGEVMAILEAVSSALAATTTELLDDPATPSTDPPGDG